LYALGGANDTVPVAKRSKVLTVDAGDTIIASGAEGAIVGSVLAGILKLVKSLPDGRQQIVGLLHPGDFFGWPPNDPLKLSIEAATDAQLRLGDLDLFEASIVEDPMVGRQLLQMALQDLGEARMRGVIMGCQSPKERVASYLLIALERRSRTFGRHLKLSANQITALKISRRDLASYLSTTVETISRVLHEFANAELIGLLEHDHFEVIDHDGLIHASGLANEDLVAFERKSLSIATEQQG
jgi:CRP/FNR family transcriptional regulator